MSCVLPLIISTHFIISKYGISTLFHSYSFFSFQTVHHEYLQVANKVVNKIDKNINELLERIFPGDIALILDGGSHQSGSDSGGNTSHQQDSWESLVEKVERLVNARTTLVETTNGEQQDLRCLGECKLFLLVFGFLFYGFC